MSGSGCPEAAPATRSADAAVVLGPVRWSRLTVGPSPDGASGALSGSPVRARNEPATGRMARTLPDGSRVEFLRVDERLSGRPNPYAGPAARARIPGRVPLGLRGCRLPAGGLGSPPVTFVVNRLRRRGE